jgi:tripartite-type tricarboxylate transporter receptor subunit TctC
MAHSPFSRRALPLAGAALLLLCAAASPVALAQPDWPQQPVTLIMGFPAGSGVDVVARTIQEPLARQLGRPVIIDYKSGAAGNIASDTWRTPGPTATRSLSAPRPRMAAMPRSTRSCLSTWRPTSCRWRRCSTCRTC